jgi:hypothetical protein
VTRSERVIVQSRGGSSQPHRLRFARQCLDSASWIVPSAILALVPKCPACLAAYLAAGTGLGLSLMAATQLRVVLLTLNVTTLLYLAVKRLCRFGTTERKKIAPHGHPNISG